MSDSLWPHRLKHTRLLCPLLCPGVCSNSCPFSRWCYLTISSSTTLFSFCFQSFPASGSFPMSQLFAPGGQSIGASPSVLPMNILGLFSLELTSWISLQTKGLSRVFFSTTVPKYKFFGAQPSLWSNSICDYGKTIGLTRRNFVSKVMSLLFNMLSRLIIAFLPRTKHLLISWLQSPSAVILEPKKIKSVMFPLFPHLFAMKWWNWMPWL